MNLAMMCESVSSYVPRHDEVIAPHHAAAADEEDIDPRLIAAFLASDDIHIFLPNADDLLVLVDDLHCVEAVAKCCGTLELEVLGSFGHRLLKLDDDLVGVALQECDDLFDDFVVFLLVGVAGARSHTALDVVLEAGTLSSPVIFMVQERYGNSFFRRSRVVRTEYAEA